MIRRLADHLSLKSTVSNASTAIRLTSASPLSESTKKSPQPSSDIQLQRNLPTNKSSETTKGLEKLKMENHDLPLSKEEFINQKCISFESFKKMDAIFRNEKEMKVEEAYQNYLNGMYNTYLRSRKKQNEPGRIS